MSPFTKLRLTLALMARRLRPKKRKVDFGAPSPHSRRWDERERAQSMQQQQLGRAAVRAFNARMLALIVALFVISLAANLLLPPIYAVAVGLTLFVAVLAFYLLRPRQNRAYHR